MPKVARSVKEALFFKGTARVQHFCEHNNLPVPAIHQRYKWEVSACAFYRPQRIEIYLPDCAHPATQAQVRNWNWWGSVTDREPGGVLCHELGHHCDWLVGKNKQRHSSEYSTQVMLDSGEKPITSYCPNSAEFFAEMFRLFVTNHALLQIIRPITHRLLTKKFKPVSHDDWEVELGPDVPDRIIKNLYKKL